MLSLRTRKIICILTLPAIVVVALLFCCFSDKQKDVSKEQSQENFDTYHSQILEYFESEKQEYTSTDIEKVTNHGDVIRWNIKYTVEEAVIYLSLSNTDGIERYNLIIESTFSESDDGKTKLPVDMINDINDIISGHSYNKSDLTDLVLSAYEKNSYEEEKEKFKYIAYDRDFVGFHENWTVLYTAKRKVEQYEEEFNLWGLTKQGTK